MKKYSIVVPVWNGGQYLKDCVSSVLAQTYPHFNLILLESCSTDGTGDWLKTLTDPRIQVYYSPAPLNIIENWSRILQVPLNEFVTITGQDDLLLPTYLDTMNSLIEKHPAASLYQTHFSFIDKNSKPIRQALPMDEKQEAHELLACLMADTFDSMATGYLFRSKDYLSLGGISTAYPDLLFADNELWINLTARGYKATALANGFLYRMHQSLSRTTTGMNYYKSFHQYILYLKKMKAEYTGMNEVIQRYGKGMLYHFCEAVAHRLLKTPFEKRNLRVREFVEHCYQYAEWLIPGESFEPLLNKRIQMAATVDDFMLSRNLFQTIRKLYKKPF